MRPDWDFLPFVADIASLWEGLADGTISNDIQIILILDTFFDPEGNDKAFEKLIASMGPHCFMGILHYQPKYNSQMRDRINFEEYASSIDNNLYYFIDPKHPRETIDSALSDYYTKGPDEVINIIRGRVSDYDREQKLRERELEEKAQYAANHEPSPYLGQVVAVTSSKGGSGKSTVAVSLATFLSHASINSVREGLEEKPLKVLILDLDVRDGQLGFLTGNSSPSVINLRLKGISKETIEETVIPSSRLKCDLLLAPKRPRHSDDTPPEFYVELLHNLRQMYDYIILDTSVNYLDPLLEKVAYPLADQIVFVTDIVVNSVFSMTRWIQEVTKEKEKGGMGIARRKIAIVVNKSLSDVNMSSEKIANASLGLPVLSVIPSNPKLIAHAANMQSMEVVLKHKDLYPAIKKIARGLVGRKYNLSHNVTV